MDCTIALTQVSRRHLMAVIARAPGAAEGRRDGAHGLRGDQSTWLGVLAQIEGITVSR
jgi:hypothetical protein